MSNAEWTVVPKVSVMNWVDWLAFLASGTNVARQLSGLPRLVSLSWTSILALFPGTSLALRTYPHCVLPKPLDKKTMKRTRITCLIVPLLVITMLWTGLVSALDHQHRRHHRKERTVSSSHNNPRHQASSTQHQTALARHVSARSLARLHRLYTHHIVRVASQSSHTIDKRGLPGIAGDIEWMGFYGSLLAVPTMLSVLGIITNYNLEKSYFNSQLNAQYYRQTREMLRAHSAKLIQEQEAKFAKAGQTWTGMIYNADGELNKGVTPPSWNGKMVGTPQKTAEEPGPANANGTGGQKGQETSEAASAGADSSTQEQEANGSADGGGKDGGADST